MKMIGIFSLTGTSVRYLIASPEPTPMTSKDDGHLSESSGFWRNERIPSRHPIHFKIAKRPFCFSERYYSMSFAPAAVVSVRLGNIAWIAETGTQSFATIWRDWPGFLSLGSLE